MMEAMRITTFTLLASGLLLLAACGQAPTSPPEPAETAPSPADTDPAAVRLRIRGRQLSIDPDAIYINVQLTNETDDWVRFRSRTVQAHLHLEEDAADGWQTIYRDPPLLGEPKETRSLGPGEQVNCGDGSVKLPNAATRLRATVPYLPRGAEEEAELVITKDLHRFE